MTDTTPLSRRTITVVSSSGKPLLKVPLLPAAAAAAVALALAPRLTALAALGALLRRLSLSLNPAPARDAAT
jgi:hypothetical protein